MQSVDLHVKNGKTLVGDRLLATGIAVHDGKITAIGPDLDVTATREIDAGGSLVLPGIIDPHTHMGIPIKNTSSADDFYTGTEAAAFGGVTTILDFSVQQQGQSLRAALDDRIARAAGKACIDVGFHVNVTDHPEKWIPQIPELIRDGFTSFKVFSTYREAGMMIDWKQFSRVLNTVHENGGTLMLHAEDNPVIEMHTVANMASGRCDAIYHARSRPAEAEAAAIEKAAGIAGDYSARLYIVHVSSRAGLEAGLRARDRGVDIFLETCPQYLLLDESKYYERNGHYYIATPALRSMDDRKALWQALSDGSIDTIGTDHCPFTRAQKDVWEGHFHLCPNGLPGVETAFPLLYTYGVATGKISLPRLMEFMSRGPAKIFGLHHRKGALTIGADADMFIYDPDVRHVISSADIHGAADWTPYEGMAITGKVTHTISRGITIIDEGYFTNSEGHGQILRSRPIENA